MTPNTIELFRQRLLAQREDLRRNLEAHGDELREAHATADIAGGDRAAEWDDAEVESRVVESEELLLAKVDHALDRIERGTYGLCEGCGDNIPTARLEAKPSVSLCVDCQEVKEAG